MATTFPDFLYFAITPKLNTTYQLHRVISSIPGIFFPTFTLRSHLNPSYANLDLKQRPLTILRDVTFTAELNTRNTVKGRDKDRGTPKDIRKHEGKV